MSIYFIKNIYWIVLREVLNRYVKIKIRYNKLCKLKRDKKRRGLQISGRMKSAHNILQGDCRPCPRKLYS